MRSRFISAQNAPLIGVDHCCALAADVLFVVWAGQGLLRAQSSLTRAASPEKEDSFFNAPCTTCTRGHSGSLTKDVCLSPGINQPTHTHTRSPFGGRPHCAVIFSLGGGQCAMTAHRKALCPRNQTCNLLNVRLALSTTMEGGFRPTLGVPH